MTDIIKGRKMKNNNEAIEALESLALEVPIGNESVEIIRKALQPPKGYVLVPEEPTEEMMTSYYEMCDKQHKLPLVKEMVQAIYSSMIQAGRKDD